MKRPLYITTICPLSLSRSFNLHLSHSLLLLLLVYFSVLANVSSVVFGPFFASPVVASLIEHTRTYISSTIRKRPTDGEKEEKRKRKNERIEDYVCCPDHRSPSPSLSLSLIQLRGQSSSSLRKRHICSVVFICSDFFLSFPFFSFIVDHLYSITVFVNE